MITTAVCLFFILLGFEPVVNTLLRVFPAGFVEQLTNLSFPYHFDAIQRGMLDLRDIFYFVSVMLFGLFAGAVILDRAKAN